MKKANVYFHNSQLIIIINRSFHRCISSFLLSRKSFSSSQNFLVHCSNSVLNFFSNPLVFHSIINSPFFSLLFFLIHHCAILYLEIVKTSFFFKRRNFKEKILEGEIFLLIVKRRNDIHFSYASFLHSTCSISHYILKLLAFPPFFHVKCFDSLQLGHKFHVVVRFFVLCRKKCHEIFCCEMFQSVKVVLEFIESKKEEF